MAIELLNNKTLSLTTIKRLYIANKTVDGKPIEFPVNYKTVTGDTSIIMVESFDPDTNTVYIGEQLLELTPVKNINDSNIIYTEELVKSKEGSFYKNTLSFELPMVYYYTNVLLKELYFYSNGQFATSNVIAFVIDANDNKWVLGYENPLVLQSTLDVGISDTNFYKLTFISNSYSRAKTFTVSGEYVPPKPVCTIVFDSLNYDDNTQDVINTFTVSDCTGDVYLEVYDDTNTLIYSDNPVTSPYTFNMETVCPTCTSGNYKVYLKVDGKVVSRTFDYIETELLSFPYDGMIAYYKLNEKS